jgi:hypothetical protein
MPRRISTSVQGGPTLGSFTALDNNLSTIVTDDDMIMEPSGTGNFVIHSHTILRDAKELRLNDGDNSNYLALKSPTTVGSNITYTLPGSGVTSGHFLQTDTNGNLSWAEANVEVSNTTTSGTTHYPSLTTATSGIITSVNVSNTKLSFVPSTGTLSATKFTGNVTSSSVDINGGNVDGTTIGASVAAPGTFTTLSCTSIQETSSIAYKENVNIIDNALEKVMQLTGVTYDRIDGSAKDEAGLIAEEVNEILPNLVNKKNGVPESLAYTKLTAYLIEAVKTLKTELDEIKGVRN